MLVGTSFSGRVWADRSTTQLCAGRFADYRRRQSCGIPVSRPPAHLRHAAISTEPECQRCDGDSLTQPDLRYDGRICRRDAIAEAGCSGRVGQGVRADWWITGSDAGDCICGCRLLHDASSEKRIVYQERLQSATNEGADAGIRTPDLLFTKQLLCQLSYVGETSLYQESSLDSIQDWIAAHTEVAINRCQIITHHRLVGNEPAIRTWQGYYLRFVSRLTIPQWRDQASVRR